MARTSTHPPPLWPFILRPHATMGGPRRRGVLYRAPLCTPATAAAMTASSNETHPQRATASLIAAASARSAHGAERHSFTGVRIGAPLPFNSTTTNLAGSALQGPGRRSFGSCPRYQHAPLGLRSGSPNAPPGAAVAATKPTRCPTKVAAAARTEATTIAMTIQFSGSAAISVLPLGELQGSMPLCIARRSSPPPASATGLPGAATKPTTARRPRPRFARMMRPPGS